MNSSVRTMRAKGRQPLRVGATPVPHAEILDSARTELGYQGFDLRIEIFDNFDELNELLVAGRLHANFFQYLPFLDEFNRRTGSELVPVAPVHIEPFGLYSTWIPDVGAIPDYAEVGLPSDAVNTDRALMMLDRLGLIGLATGRRGPATVSDIRANPRDMLFKEFSSWQLAGVRRDVDVVFLFGNQAMEWGVDTAGALHCDRADPRYAEYLVARPDTCQSPGVTALAEALNAEATREFIATTYAGQVVAAF
ncbi:MetQ/NlpA family ABC transporter substrate-binding protein [Mycolicibacterium sp. F2034L]|uniref:MetQ/NlpA family ABC transporter substrate-binding protein n=1 Tax=Mycolicibacterium sp. F2034L TaxID=2926422 RepID=UPI001FF4C27E|nr:MetQ/NlpA family ABC transporter substrate-binding protein [Mycolicibacterium sp. F2034L]MCK0174114.1 MetQ/NlpA family ABC transporter substrate-binding protein [Mycolicibacterium sp. F2034L]